jgi:hypothetical protein
LIVTTALEDGATVYAVEESVTADAVDVLVVEELAASSEFGSTVTPPQAASTVVATKTPANRRSRP